MKRKPSDHPRETLWFVVWEDVTDDPRWLDAKDADQTFKEPTLIEQVGYRVAQSKKYVLLASQKSSDGDWGNLTMIPRVLIRKMRRL